MSNQARYAGCEIGGTKVIAVLAEGDVIIDRVALPSAMPEDSLPALRAQIDRWHADVPLAGLGIASFGPIQVNPSKERFGCILPTPKPGWTGAQVGPILTDGLGVPFAIDTDVNGAALAEYQWGAGRGCSSLCYVTIGTGLGGGVLVNGEPIHGAMHPEIGHVRLRRAAGDTFAGACNFHGDCIEGLVCGPALAKRFGMDAAEASDDHPVWRDVASDLAELCGTILLSTAAERILFGGSVATYRSFLLPWAREQLVAQLGSYLPYLTAESATDIVRPAGLGTEAGPMGAIALAQRAAKG
jgi:fructokinase